MKILLDNHSFLWFINGDSKLSESARKAIENPINERHLSIASMWEMGIKYSIGKLQFAQPFEILIPQQILRNRIASLPITFEHISRVSVLPFHHKDPFDRIIIAQSLVESMPIVGNDGHFDVYGVQRIW